jgi:HEPN domain-containing protein
MSKERMKHSRYLKNAEDNLKKAVLLDDYSNRCFKITTKISKSAKYRIRNPTKIIKGANYESDASDISESSNMEQSEANYECDASDAMDISPPESSEEELSSNEADLVWLDPEILKKADSLESGEIPELFQLLTKNDLAELGKSEFGKLVRTFFI